MAVKLCTALEGGHRMAAHSACYKVREMMKSVRIGEMGVQEDAGEKLGRRFEEVVWFWRGVSWCRVLCILGSRTWRSLISMAMVSGQLGVTNEFAGFDWKPCQCTTEWPSLSVSLELSFPGIHTACSPPKVVLIIPFCSPNQLDLLGPSMSHARPRCRLPCSNTHRVCEKK